MLPYFQFAMLYNFLFASHSMPQSVRRFQSIFKIPTSYGPVFWKSNLAKKCPKNTIEEAFLPLLIGTLFCNFRLTFQDFSLQLMNDEKILEVFLWALKNYGKSYWLPWMTQQLFGGLYSLLKVFLRCNICSWHEEAKTVLTKRWRQ